MDTPSGDHRPFAAALVRAHAAVGAAQVAMLDVIATCEREVPFDRDGARDVAGWVAAQLGVSNWTARRLVGAARALGNLPATRAALAGGRLSLDKAIELCRFATPHDEVALIAWARAKAPAAVRRRADASVRRDLDAAAADDRGRYLRWWLFDDDTRMGIEGSLPAGAGAAVATALDRLARRMPDIVCDGCDGECTCDRGPDPEESLDARRADALVALASASIAADADADRATVVLHADVADLVAVPGSGDAGGCEIEHGGVVHPEVARRLCCDARVQAVVVDGYRGPIGVGHTTRTVPPWLQRLLRRRDGGCTFPGCGARWFLHAHHVRHWLDGGPTDFTNLVLVCPYHHRLVHEHRWRVRLDRTGLTTWARPDGAVYRAAEAGRAPPVCA